MALSIKVAAAQLAPVFFDRDASVEKACDAILEAGRNGAALIAFPETFLPGYPYFAMVLPPLRINSHMLRMYDQAITVPSAATDAICDAARRANCHVVMGLNERERGTLYNGQLFVAADGSMFISETPGGGGYGLLRAGTLGTRRDAEPLGGRCCGGRCFGGGGRRLLRARALRPPGDTQTGHRLGPRRLSRRFSLRRLSRRFSLDRTRSRRSNRRCP